MIFTFIKKKIYTRIRLPQMWSNLYLRDSKHVLSKWGESSLKRNSLMLYGDWRQKLLDLYQK